MPTFGGTYECKMDPKNRIVLPAKLKARLPEASEHRIVILRGFRKCLTVYPMVEWEKRLESFAQISEYDEEGQQFIRDYTFGMTEEVLDSQGRFSLNKFLIEYAGLKSDVVVCGIANRIEIWDSEDFMKGLTPSSDRASLQKLAGKLLDQKPQTPKQD